MSRICVLIHGYLTDYRDFKSLPGKLIKIYDQVILLCLPGHENKCNLKNFTKDACIKQLDSEFSELTKNNEVDVIGFSLGGALAWYVGLNYPVNKLVLLAPALDNINTNLVIDKINYLKKIKKLSKESQKELLSAYFKKEREAVNFVIKNSLPKFTLRNGLEFVKLVNYINSINGDVDKPCLIIRGELDELVKAKAVTKIIPRIIGYKEVYRIPDIGHMMLRTDREDYITQLIINFLGSAS